MACPQGYPYILLVAQNYLDNDISFILDTSIQKARLENSAARVNPVKVLDLIDTFGHKKTSNFLKNISQKWMTKENCFYFNSKKNIDKSNLNIEENNNIQT